MVYELYNAVYGLQNVAYGLQNMVWTIERGTWTIEDGVWTIEHGSIVHVQCLMVHISLSSGAWSMCHDPCIIFYIPSTMFYGAYLFDSKQIMIYTPYTIYHVQRS